MFTAWENCCVYVTIAGPNHVNIYISPKHGVEVIWWSVGDEYPQPIDMPDYVDRYQYFIFYSYGTYKQPFELTIDVEVSCLTELLLLLLGPIA